MSAMKVLLILWVIGLAVGEKLDRTYLPPPGSITAGGDSGILDLPKENYSSTFQPGEDPSDISLLKPNFPNVALGIDRKGPTVSSAASVTTGPSLFSKNTFKVPSTTSSYTFTQTSTLSPVKSYDTTIGPVSSRGYPSKSFSNLNYPGKSDFVDANDPGSNDVNRNNGRLSTDVLYWTPNSQNIQNIQSSSMDNSIPAHVNQVPLEGESSLVTKQSNTNYPSTQYGSDLDNVSEVTSSTASTYPDNYYNEQSSVNYKPSGFSQTNLENERYPGLQDDISGIYGFQSPTNIFLPNQYTETASSPSDSSIALSEFTSAPKYSSTIEISNPTRPERVQAEFDRNAVIINYENILTPEGFAYSFDTSNGIHADESGTAIDGVKAQGSYSYTGDDGKIYSVVYTADENGFLPRGDHLPTAPPIPDAILKVIEQAAKNKPLGFFDDGSYDDAKYGHGRYQGLMGQNPQIQSNNVIGKLIRNDGDNLNDGRKENLPGNFNDQSDQAYKSEEVAAKSGPPYYSDENIKNIEDSNSAIEEKQYQSNKDNQRNYDDVSVSTKVQDINNQFYNVPLDKSQFTKGTFAPSNYESDIPKTAKIPSTINKFSQTNVNLPTNFDILNPTTQVSNISKEYVENTNQGTQTGYDYTQPQRAFNLNEENNLRSRFSSPNKQSESPKSGDKPVKGGTTPMPFMTPNVSFNLNSQRTDDGDDSSNSQPSIQKTNRPLYKSTGYFQNGNTDFIQTEPTFYNSQTDNNEEVTGVTDRVFSTRRPEYGSTFPARDYQVPYTSTVIENGSQPNNYPTKTFDSQYASTTPLPSEFSSQSTPSIIYTKTPTSQFSTISTPSIATETYLRPRPISRKPGNRGRINEVNVPTTRPDDVINRRVTPGTTYNNRGYKQPISQGTSEDGLKPRFGESRPNFGSESTTERLIGEDFSGPKQPQRFDSERGYYY